MSKISCYSRRTVASAIETNVAKVIKCIDSNVSWTLEEKENVKSRFRETFNSVIKQNVVINGEDWATSEAKADVTSDLEAVDTEKQCLITALAKDVDRAVVETTNKRKYHPYECKRHMARQCKHEQVFLESVTAQVESCVDVEHSPNPQLPQATQARHKDTCQQVSQLTKVIDQSVPHVLSKAEQLQESINLHSCMAGSVTDRVVYHRHPQEDQMAASLTPLRQKLTQS